MKHTFAALAAALIAASLAGCSTAAPGASGTTPSPSTTEGSVWAVTATPSAGPTSAAATAATCSALFDSSQGMLLFKTVQALSAVSAGDLTQATTARAASEALGRLHDNAAPEMQSDIYELQMVAMKASVADGPRQLNLSRASKALLDLTKECPAVIARYKATTAAAASARPPAEVQAAYQRQLEAIGIHPANWSDYTARMKAGTCEATVEEMPSNIAALMNTAAPEAASEAISLTVGAFCPDQALELAQAFFELSQQ